MAPGTMAYANGNGSANGNGNGHAPPAGGGGGGGVDFTVDSPHVVYRRDPATGEVTGIESAYMYESSSVSRGADGSVRVTPRREQFRLRTDVASRPSRLGVMLVGLGGNNGTTVMGGVLANRMKMRWRTKEGEHAANWYGSMLQCGVVKLGDDEATGEEVHVPFRSLLPMVDPSHGMEIGGWDINGSDMATAMERARVLDYALQEQLAPHMRGVVPLPGIYDPEFIAANQARTPSPSPSRITPITHSLTRSLTHSLTRSLRRRARTTCSTRAWARWRWSSASGGTSASSRGSGAARRSWCSGPPTPSASAASPRA